MPRNGGFIGRQVTFGKDDEVNFDGITDTDAVLVWGGCQSQTDEFVLDANTTYQTGDIIIVVTANDSGYIEDHDSRFTVKLSRSSRNSITSALLVYKIPASANWTGSLANRTFSIADTTVDSVGGVVIRYSSSDNVYYSTSFQSGNSTVSNFGTVNVSQEDSTDSFAHIAFAMLDDDNSAPYAAPSGYSRVDACQSSGGSMCINFRYIPSATGSVSTTGQSWTSTDSPLGIPVLIPVKLSPDSKKNVGIFDTQDIYNKKVREVVRPELDIELILGYSADVGTDYYQKDKSGDYSFQFQGLSSSNTWLSYGSTYYNNKNPAKNLNPAVRLKDYDNWHIETWFNLAELPSSGEKAGLFSHFSNYSQTGSTDMWVMTLDSAGKPALYHNWSIFGSMVNTSFVCSINTWYHLVLVRRGSQMAFYINGTREAFDEDGGDTFDMDADDQFYFGGLPNSTGQSVSSWSMKGYLDNLKISAGRDIYNPADTTIVF